MTSTNDPDVIRADIERTQHDLSRDVDAVTEKVSPGRIVERRADRVRGAAGRWKEAVMGGSDHDGHPGDLRDSAHRVTGSVTDTASSASSSVASAAHEAPRAARRRAQGNPLAAGLIAFGAGLLVSSLLPASRREQELAEQAERRAAEYKEPVTDAARRVTGEVREQLEEPAQQAVDSVRGAATDAGHTVADEGRGAAHEVRDQARGSASAVRTAGDG